SPKGPLNRLDGPNAPKGPRGPRWSPLPVSPLSGPALAFGAAVTLGSAVVLGSAPVAGAGAAAMTATTPTIISTVAATRIPAREADTRPVPRDRTGPWNSRRGW